MDLAMIERLMQMLDRSSLTSLDVTEGNLRIRLSKAGDFSPQGEQAAQVAHMQSESEPGGSIIVAGLAGTFYRAPAPDAPPFVVEGDSVAEGQCLGLIEAMKMLNPVEGDIAGVIRRIFLADATPVAPGDQLFEIGPA